MLAYSGIFSSFSLNTRVLKDAILHVVAICSWNDVLPQIYFLNCLSMSTWLHTPPYVHANMQNVFLLPWKTFASGFQKFPPQILWIRGRRKWKPVVFCFGSPLEFKECLSMLEIEVAKLLFSIVAGCVFIRRWTWMRLCGWLWLGGEIGGLALLARLYGRTLVKKACILMWCHDTYLNEKSWVVLLVVWP